MPYFWQQLAINPNLSNFVPPTWKLHNPYYHNVYAPMISLQNTKTSVKKEMFNKLEFSFSEKDTQIWRNLPQGFDVTKYSLMNMRQLHILFNSAKTWRVIVCWFLCFTSNSPEFTWTEPKIVLNIRIEQF